MTNEEAWRDALKLTAGLACVIALGLLLLWIWMAL